MTLEEAQSLGPGDIIKGSWSGTSERTIESCFIRGGDLYWNQAITKGHSWGYEDIFLVKKVHNVEPQINNDYSIF